MKPGRDQEFTIQHFDRMFYMLNNKDENNQNGVNANTIAPPRNAGLMQGRVSKADFMKIFEVYELWKYESQFSHFYQSQDDEKRVSSNLNAGGNRRFMNRTRKFLNESCFSRVKSIITSINYELTLNIICILMFTEISFNEALYDNMINSIDVWIIVQLSINCFFTLTLLLDWATFGIRASYSKHPRVAVETISQLIFIVAVVKLLLRGKNLFIYYYDHGHESEDEAKI
jgi:hypothetical protein